MATPPPAAELTDHLGFWLRMVSNHVSHAFAAKVAGVGVTVTEWVVLRTLYGRPPLQPSQLADEIGMTRGAITKLADRLIAKSMLRREASTTDGRAQTLALTDEGIGLVPRLAALADRNEIEFFGQLGEDDRRDLERVLRRIVEQTGMTGMPTE